LITVSHQQWIFETCGSTATDLLMLLFTRYRGIKLYLAYRYQQQWRTEGRGNRVTTLRIQGKGASKE